MFLEVDTVLIGNWTTYQVAYLTVSLPETKEMYSLKSLDGLFVNTAVRFHCIKVKM